MNDYITASELKKFYNSKLRRKVSRLEASRKSIVFFVSICSFIGIFIIVGTFLGWLNTYYETLFEYILQNGKLKLENPIPLIIPLCLILAFFATSVSYYGKMTFGKKFKNQIIREALSVLLPGNTFQINEKIPKSDFDKSKLNESDYNVYTGEDLVTGKYGDVEISFSELVVEEVSRTSKKKSTVTHFCGLFFKCTFKNRAQTDIIIQRDQAEKLLGRYLGRALQKKKSRAGYELIQFESIDFEKRFVVYAKDQIKARVILNPKALDDLNRFLKQYKQNIDISIVGNNIYFRLHSGKDFFEPNLFSKSIGWPEIRELHQIIKLMMNLVDHLNLDC